MQFFALKLHNSSLRSIKHIRSFKRGVRFNINDKDPEKLKLRKQ